MTAIERLQAAIEKLERLKDESTPGPWLVNVHHNAKHSAEFRAPSPWNGFMLVAAHGNDTDPELVVTLHRTLVAQLALLRFAVDGLYDLPEFLMLADAVLGSDS